MQPTYSKQSKLKLVTTVVAIVVIAGIVVLVDHLKSTEQTSDMTSNASTTAQSTTTMPSTSSSSTDSSSDSSNETTSSSAYKDGTYSATSDYYVPHGSEEISVTLTVKDGVITDSSITNSEGDHDSVRYQEDFTEEYKSYVVGQKLSGFKLTVISGASDTTEGFNDAVSQIETKAQAQA